MCLQIRYVQLANQHKFNVWKTKGIDHGNLVILSKVNKNGLNKVNLCLNILKQTL